MPSLYLFRGFPATGKSYWSNKIGKALSLPVIVRDHFKTDLLKQGYKLGQVGGMSYDLMWKTAFDYLIKGQSCICDTSLIQPHGIESIKQIQNKTSASILIIECFCSDRKLHHKRLTSRKNFPDHLGINTVEKLKTFNKKNKKWVNYKFPFPTIRIDTATNLTIKELLKKLPNYQSFNPYE